MQKSEKTSDTKKQAVLLTIIASSLWGTSFPAIKIGLQFMDAYTFVFLRFSFALLLMVGVLLFTKNFALNFNKKRLILFLGITNGAAYLLQYIGMFYTSASKASLLVNLTVIWVALLSPIILKEQISRKKLSGVIVSFLGIFLVTTNLNLQSFNTGEIFGDILVIAAGIIWALFIIYNKPLVNESENMIQSLTLLLLFTMIPLMPVLTITSANFLTLPWEAWIAITYTAIFCWIIPYLLWSKGLKNISPVTSSVILLNEIIVAVTISTIILKESLTLVSGIGAALIIIAIIIVSNS